MITVYQVTYDSTTGNGNVPALADRRLYEHLLLSDVGVVDGINVSASGTNLVVSSGWGVIKGAIFQVEQETIQATVPASGSVTGRLLVELNVTNSTIEFVTQAESPLPALVQEDINTNGSIYQMPLATYTISTASISGLTMVYDTLESMADFKAAFDVIDGRFPAMYTKLSTIENGAQVNTVTGVKGTKESSYRIGNVSLTAANVGAVPTTRKVNGKELSADITLTAANVGAVPTTRKINNKALTSDVDLTAYDVDAVVPINESIPTGNLVAALENFWTTNTNDIPYFGMLEADSTTNTRYLAAAFKVAASTGIVVLFDFKATSGKAKMRVFLRSSGTFTEYDFTSD